MDNIPRYAILLSLFLFAVSASSQSHALDGQIEGNIMDASGGAVPNASVIAVNQQTGVERRTVTDNDGFYRLPLLPLGSWSVSVEVNGFNRSVQSGVKLSAGQTATVNFQMEPDELVEFVTVTSDSPIADSGQTDLSRVMNGREVHNIPLPTRNPYNFVILQSNVTGRPGRGFNFPQINVNGFIRRVSYLLDGNENNRGDQAGVRLVSMSDVFVNEVQIVTNAFAPEFGNTTGMIMNIATPSGSNDLRGMATYLFRRPSFYARPFFFSAPVLPDNVTNDFAVGIKGPVIKDRWHWYLGFETIRRDDSTRSNRQVMISEAHKAELIEAGLPASIFVPAIPSQESATHFILRTDLQLNSSNSLMTRFNHSEVRTTNNIPGGRNTLERSIDGLLIDHSLAAQLVSRTSGLLNELRGQFVWLNGRNDRNAFSGTGPSITISSVANFGAPTIIGNDDLMRLVQFQDNVNVIRGSHAIKFGGGIQRTKGEDRDSVFSLYTFPSIAAFKDARSGEVPRGYSLYEQSFGEPIANFQTTFWNGYIQDDWKATRKLKLNYGLRYDLYEVPEADPASPFPASQQFNIAKTNFSPRLGIVYSLSEGDRPLLLRAAIGQYYEPQFSNAYTRALRENGAPRFFDLQFCGTAVSSCQKSMLGPIFPNSIPGYQLPGAMQNVVTISPDFENMYAIHALVQMERALTDDLSFSAVYVHSGGRHIPVYSNINPINPVRTLADGRPVFSTIINAGTRLDPRFNLIQMAESVATSRYDAIAFKLQQRYSRGLQFFASYTLSKATDDAPEQNVPYMIGNEANISFILSDPTNRALDRGYSYGDQRHTFVMSLVARPNFNIQNRFFRTVLNNNQLALLMTANSGERFTIAAGELGASGNLSPLDLNRDGRNFSDRPVGVERNSGKTPPQFSIDTRYSRFISLSERFRLELLCEVQNLFNINNIVAYGNLLAATDPTTGELLGPLPDFKTGRMPQSIESRQMQLGIKFHF